MYCLFVLGFARNHRAVCVYVHGVLKQHKAVRKLLAPTRHVSPSILLTVDYRAQECRQISSVRCLHGQRLCPPAWIHKRTVVWFRVDCGFPPHTCCRRYARPLRTTLLACKTVEPRSPNLTTVKNRISSGAPQDAPVVQAFGTLEGSRLGLSELVRTKSVAAVNRLLAHTMAVRDLYKKAHWQISGPNFYELHLLCDKHYSEQLELMDALAERVQTLGGVAFALAHDVVEETRIARAPRGRESTANQLSRLLDAHELLLEEARTLAREAAQRGDEGTNDLIVSQVVRTNELQSWFVGRHLAPRNGIAQV